MDESCAQITDETGVVIGSADMLEAFEKELIRHTVHVMLVDADERYLLQKRSPEVPNYPGYWDASAGGHVDEGEEPEAAAYRELEEELGVTDITLRHTGSFYFEAEGDDRIYKYYAHVYVGSLAANVAIHSSPDEVAETRLYSRGEITQLNKVTPITRHIVSLL